MRSGRLRKAWEIQRATETPSSTGAVIKAWRTIATRRMDIQPMRGIESLQMGQDMAQVTHRCWLRYDGRTRDLRAKDRLVRGNRTMDIEVVHNVGERNRMLELQLREVT